MLQGPKGRIPQKQIYELLAKMPGNCGLYIEDIDTKEVFELNPERIFPSASVIKIPLLALLLKDAQEGKVDLNKPHKLNDVNRVGGHGIITQVNSDYEPPLFYQAKLMVILSDNAATNEIVDVCGGFERVTKFAREELGHKHTLFGRKMMDYEAMARGVNNFMCAGDAGRMMAQIARGELVNAEISKTIHEMMSSQMCRNKLPLLVPAVPVYFPPEKKIKLDPDTVMVANKTGDLFFTQHDVGIFTLPDNRKYVISAFTGNLDHDNDGIFTIAEISKVVYEAMK
jgi:beta-lactamase class A